MTFLEALRQLTMSIKEWAEKNTAAQVADETKARRQEIAVERARLTNFINSTEGGVLDNAELTDLRMNIDGIVYPTAGDAVRSIGYDVEGLRSEFNDYVETQAIDGLFYEDNKLYLARDGIPASEPVEIIGSIGGSAPVSFVITLSNLLDSRVFVVPEKQNVTLKFNYSSVDSDGVDDGTGVGQVVVNNISRKSFAVNQGENTVDVTEFLSVGTNTVAIKVTNSENSTKTLPYTVTVAAVSLTSPFDASTPCTGAIAFPYTPVGIADKTVYFELDGVQIGSTVVSTSGRQQSYNIAAQSHGSHILRVWFTCDVSGTTVTSNVLYYNLICTTECNDAPIIAITSQPQKSATQYSNIVTKYRVYSPSSLTSAIKLEVNGEVISNLTVDRTEQTWTYRADTTGDITQAIRCGDEFVSWDTTIIESDVDVSAETEALALHLSSYGRSNNEDNPAVWENNGIAAEFVNFNFASDGWKQDDDDITVLRVIGDARLKIPYKMFEHDFRTTGKTLEFELATRNVLNYDADVLTCLDGDRGFKITAQQLHFTSEQSALGTRYKEDEHIRVSFVAEKKSDNRLLLCYINGIMSGAVQYPEDDDFSQSVPVGITIGSNECTVDLYNIRVYDNNLSRYQVLDNWIADTQNAKERDERYKRNNIYDSFGQITISKLPTDLPYLVLQCSELPQYKGDIKTCSGYFTDPQHPERSFTFQNAEIDVQGTSSQYYYVKNYKITFNDGFILINDSTVEVYQMNDNAIPVATFTMKADVASSEGAFNVVLAMIYDDLCPYKTPAQIADSRVRQTIEGFPIVMFWDKGSETKFLGKYNFNNDKETPEVFGFEPGDESWEIRQNGTDRVGWHSADFSDGWQDDFKARYPDKNTNITKLQELAAWLVSTDTAQATGNAIDPVTYDGVEYIADTIEYRLAKFSAELADHFVEEAIIFYYLFTELFLCIDQREKNAFPTYIASLDRWIVLFYDADSSLGTDNKGNLAFDYWLEDIDYTEAGDPVYNGQNSVLWKNLRLTRHNEIMTMYQDMRTSGILNYNYAIGRFEEHQSKWPEAIFNEDMHRKCIEPLIEDGDGTYIPMLQGKKEQWMKWWLYNRFRYIDSKYCTGSSMENRITIRAHQKANVSLTSYVNMYGHVYFNDSMVEHRMERGIPYEFEWPASGAEDPVIGINDADMLTNLGDLSPLMVELIDVSGANHITYLKLGDGDESYTNYSLNSVTVGNNNLLRTFDIRNCINMTQAPDVSGCTNIEEVLCQGSGITGIKLPNGGILKKLHLPETVVSLQVVNQPQLTEFSIPSYDQITTLRLENAGVLDGLALDILTAMPNNSRVRIIGLDVEVKDIGIVLKKLSSMRGLDENGNNMDTAQVSGSIHVALVTPGQASAIKSAKQTYPSLDITYDEVNAYFAHQLLDRSISGAYENDRIDTIGDYAFCTATKLSSVSFSNVESVGRGAFQSCTGITSINFPKATTIRGSAFFKCASLREVYLPSVTDIAPGNETYGFADCPKLARVDLPVITHIGNASFTNCPSLETIIIRNVDEVCAISNTNVISQTLIANGKGYIYVPKTMADGSDGVATYQAATNWSTYAAQFRAIEDYPEICGGG